MYYTNAQYNGNTSLLKAQASNEAAEFLCNLQNCQYHTRRASNNWGQHNSRVSEAAQKLLENLYTNIGHNIKTEQQIWGNGVYLSECQHHSRSGANILE